MAASANRLTASTAVACCLALCGCKTADPLPPPEAERIGEVGMEIVPPPAGATRMQLPQSQRFVFPDVEEPVALPVYPVELLQARLASVRLCVEADIGADGLVMAARPRVDEGCTDGPVREEFSTAAVEAVRRWVFAPALLCKAPDESAEDPCLHPQVEEVPTPVRLSYAFRFSQRDGEPVVEQVGQD